MPAKRSVVNFYLVKYYCQANSNLLSSLKRKKILIFTFMKNKSSLSKDVNELKRSKPTNNSVEHEAAKLTSENQEKIFLLQREKALLLSKVKRAKKDLSEMRATLKDLEFKALQDPQKYVSAKTLNQKQFCYNGVYYIGKKMYFQNFPSM